MAHTPGKPDAEPTWCSSDKDLVITSLGISHIWATIGHGILNEVYWPSTGRPQTRDLSFIVAKNNQWCEVKQLGNYKISTPKPYILLPTIEHQADDFTLTLDVLCDDLRDVVVIRFHLDSDDHRLYAILVPRLGSTADGNSAWCEGGAFYGARNRLTLSLRADVGFERQSVGYLGQNDGWQDFQQNGEMTWNHDRAEDGNVAMMGQLAASQGVLALSFSRSPEGAETLARSCLAEGYATIHDRVEAAWEEWGSQWDFPNHLDERCRAYVERSATVLKTCEDRSYPGAVVASLTIPWGNSRSDRGGYHFVWARDSVESALGMIAVEHYQETRQLLTYLMAIQHADGHWSQNFYPSGKPYLTAVQLDQTSLPILLAAKLRELRELEHLVGVDEMVRRAIAFLLRAGPVTPQDRWEENAGLSVSTLSLIVAAIVGGSAFLPHEERDFALSYADYLNRRIEDWLYVEDSQLSHKYGVAGHYIRIATPDIFSGTHGRVSIANRKNMVVPACDLVSMDFTYLARLGLRRADDLRLRDTLKVSEGELRVETPSGPSFYRYNGDGYGEHEDGSPYDGTGIGRLWPLLTGERGHLAIQLGEDVALYLDALTHMTGPGGMLPEQIWDAEAIPDRGLYPGKPTGSAMPLLWAQAEFAKLATASITKKPVELLDSVRRRYDFQQPDPPTWHWRRDAPFQEIPQGKNLLIEVHEPFRLRLTFDNWKHVEDRDSEALGLGMHGLKLARKEVERHRRVDFTFFYRDRDEWANEDYVVRVCEETIPQPPRQPIKGPPSKRGARGTSAQYLGNGDERASTSKTAKRSARSR